MAGHRIITQRAFSLLIRVAQTIPQSNVLFAADKFNAATTQGFLRVIKVSIVLFSLVFFSFEYNIYIYIYIYFPTTCDSEKP